MTSWMAGPIGAFDTETTGIDVNTDRIVTACIARIDYQHGDVTTHPWLIDPGIDIPAAATAVHGITTEHAQQHGHEPREALNDLASYLAHFFTAGIPIIGWDIPYDLTILDVELTRHGLPTLADRAPVAPVIDGLVLDKQVDRYRPGSRKLVDVCAHYGVPLVDAHDASADALAAARVVWRIGRLHPAIGQATAEQLHTAQIGWADDQQESFHQWAQTPKGQAKAAVNGRPYDIMRGWPLWTGSR